MMKLNYVSCRTHNDMEKFTCLFHADLIFVREFTLSASISVPLGATSNWSLEADNPRLDAIDHLFFQLC